MYVSVYFIYLPIYQGGTSSQEARQDIPGVKERISSLQSAIESNQCLEAATGTKPGRKNAAKTTLNLRPAPVTNSKIKAATVSAPHRAIEMKKIREAEPPRVPKTTSTMGTFSEQGTNKRSHYSYVYGVTIYNMAISTSLSGLPLRWSLNTSVCPFVQSWRYFSSRLIQKNANVFDSRMMFPVND